MSITPGFEWKCKRCRKEIMAWTETGLNNLVDFHMDEHHKEDRERMQQFAEVDVSTKNYDKLKITYLDLVFLTTRHIAIDDDMEQVDDIDERPSRKRGVS